MPIEIKTPLMNKTLKEINVGDAVKLYFVAGATVFAGKVLLSTMNHLANEYKTFFVKEDK